MIGTAFAAVAALAVSAPSAAQAPAQIDPAVKAAYDKYKHLQEGKNAPSRRKTRRPTTPCSRCTLRSGAS